MANEISNLAVDDICLSAVPLTYGDGAIAEVTSMLLSGNWLSFF
ncbi:hypothetical protein [uncultured Duncaniella sp.]|jgi:hypothetical protein|nr:hypothetical protein [uncultured Duncaniella sp.]